MDEFDNAFSLLDKIRDGKMSLADAKNDQAEFKSNLNEIKKGNKKTCIKRAKKCIEKYWNALQSNKQRYWIFWYLFLNGIHNKT